MARTKGLPGPAIGLAAAGGLLIYAGVADKSPVVALRELVKGVASPPAPFKTFRTEPFAGGEIGSVVGGGTEFGKDAAQVALQQIGKRYVRGAKGPDEFDCSGLVFYCYRTAGATDYPYMPSAVIAVSPRFTKIPRSQVGAGDILWFPGHVAIAISNTELVEAYTGRAPVRRTEIKEGRFRMFLRYTPRKGIASGRAA